MLRDQGWWLVWCSCHRRPIAFEAVEAFRVVQIGDTYVGIHLIHGDVISKRAVFDKFACCGGLLGYRYEVCVVALYTHVGLESGGKVNGELKARRLEAV